MSWIPCTEPCLYQQEGYCTLDKADDPPPQPAAGISSCFFFAPRKDGKPPLFLDGPEGL